jgi:hypothetical protein
MRNLAFLHCKVNRDQHPELMVDAGLRKHPNVELPLAVVALSGNEERQLLSKRTPEGFRAIDVGPLTMSYREDHSPHRLRPHPPTHLPQRRCVLHMIRVLF